MRKKQLTMQQGLALGCLILLVCAVVFGIVLRATRAHDLEDPEKWQRLFATCPQTTGLIMMRQPKC